jgi:hypothetical protein
MALTPKRTQYPPQLSNIKFRTPTQTTTLTRQWETFERVENYNDIVYQQLEQGNRGTLYYQFVNQSEQRDYAAGQMLHINFYTALPVSTFAPISTRPMPNVPVKVPAPTCQTSMPSIVQLKTADNVSYTKTTLTAAAAASESVRAVSDCAIYETILLYNSTHKYQYNFQSAAEQQAYNRAAGAAATQNILSLPDYVCRD